jgi:hypothetical protein
MSFERKLPDAPEPRGVVGWLRFGAIISGVLAAFVVDNFLGRPLDALSVTWGLPHRLSLGRGLFGATASLGVLFIMLEWTRPARRFLAAHGLPRAKGGPSIPEADLGG